MGARLLPQPYHYPDFSEAADRVGAQLRGDKECPFSGVTKSDRVWRKVPESGARSVGTDKTVEGKLTPSHARKHETHPPRVKKEKKEKKKVPSRLLVLFELT